MWHSIIKHSLAAVIRVYLKGIVHLIFLHFSFLSVTYDKQNSPDKNTEILEYVVNIVLIRKNKSKALVAHLTSYRILLVLSMSPKIKASPFLSGGRRGVGNNTVCDQFYRPIVIPIFCLRPMKALCLPVFSFMSEITDFQDTFLSPEIANVAN